VRLVRGNQVLTRQVHANGGYLSQSSLMVHFGLGEKPDYDRIEITWPRGIKQKLTGLAANTLHKIAEPPRDSP
jgi:hypothetical protein